MLTLKKLIYWLGLRPRRGSIFYSPSLSIVFGFRKAVRKMRWK